MPFKTKSPLHPGQVLLDSFLKPSGLSQKELAEHLGWTYARLNEIVNMRRGVTADSALSFSEAFCSGPEFWLNLQRDWDLWFARQAHSSVKPLQFFKEKM